MTINYYILSKKINIDMRPKLKTRRKIVNKVKCANYRSKVKSGSKKRFRLTGSGKLIATQAGKQHNMRKRSARQIRNQRGTVVLENGLSKQILTYHNLHLSSKS